MKINKKKVVAIDFETFYDKGYSLTDKDMNMSEYVRDERFKIHCLGIKIGDDPVKVVRGEDVAEFLKTIDWSDKLVLAHNTAFDGFILSHHFGIVPLGYLDTLSMSRALYGHAVKHNLESVALRLGLGGKIRGALEPTKGIEELPEAVYKKLAEYCANDVELCHEIFWKLYNSFPDEELLLVDITLRMFCDPKLKVNIPLAQEELESQVGSKVAAVLRSGVTADQLISNKKFAALLQARGATLPLKVSKTTKKITYAFAKSDKEFKLLASNSNEDIQNLCAARLAVKSTIGETRAERLIAAGVDDMSLPVLLHYYGAHTGRWSGGNKINLQNLPRGGKLRLALTAPKGYVIVVSDSSQIEARITAWLAGEHEIIQAFKDKRGIYEEFAAKIYKIPVSAVTDIQRFVGKTCILGLGYGMGAQKLQETLAAGVNGPAVHLTLSECQRLVNMYRSTYPMIVSLWNTARLALLDMVQGINGEIGPVQYEKERVILPNQMKLLYPDLGFNHGTELTYTTRMGFTKIYGGLFTENIVQALARIIIGGHMIKISSMYPIVTMSHDEIVWLAPEDEAEDSLECGIQIMKTIPPWAAGLPLDAKGGYDKHYSK